MAKQYRPVAIHPALQPYVRGIFIQEELIDPVQAEHPYTVFPKPYPVVGFQYSGRLRVIRGGQEEFLTISGITGLQEMARTFRASTDTRTILVAFKPYGAFVLLACPMDRLADNHVGLGQIVGGSRLRILEEQLAESCDTPNLSRLVQNFLLFRLTHAQHEAHPPVMRAADRLLVEGGTTPIESVAKESGISRRQLERLFHEQIGVGPKRFAALVRFEWALRHLNSYSSCADLAYDAGYADQAHFVRSFRDKAGMTPGEYRRQAASPHVAFLQDDPPSLR
jgi:AraC-like DNA-binding protein